MSEGPMSLEELLRERSGNGVCVMSYAASHGVLRIVMMGGPADEDVWLVVSCVESCEFSVGGPRGDVSVRRSGELLELVGPNFRVTGRSAIALRNSEKIAEDLQPGAWMEGSGIFVPPKRD